MNNFMYFMHFTIKLLLY